MYINRDKEIEARINSEIDRHNTAYKVSDSEGNTFVFGGIENGHPWFRGLRGSKHIFDLTGYTVIQKYCSM
jgi:hypothetical protein